MDNSGSKAVPVKTDLPMTVRTQLNIKSHRFQIKQDKPAEIAGCVEQPLGRHNGQKEKNLERQKWNTFKRRF
jgi:hypothetical protein